VFDNRFLDWIHASVVHQSLYGDDLRTLRLDRQRQTGIHGFTVQ
jgi:hypothetical protein